MGGEAAAHMERMTHIDAASVTARENARTGTGQFGAQQHSAPEATLPTGPTCTECGAQAQFRLADIARGHRSKRDPAYCAAHAADAAADGANVEQMPRPQEPGEALVWVIEGDDHEVEIVEADSEDEALDAGAALFADRYGDDDDDDGEYRSDPRDIVRVAGAFRGDIDATDELEFVPVEGTTETAAYYALDNA
jgi:hypothetical protein